MEKTAEKIKQFLPVFITILAVTMLFTGMACRQANNSFTNEDFIRFHVIANSDSDEDQALKLRVRDRLIEYINDGLRREAVRQSDGGGKTAELNIEETRDYIRENLGEIRQKAQEVVQNEGWDYEVNAELGVRWIPEKSYGSLTFPAGNYEALNITIGEGAGKNWWCVLYPPLCLLDVQEEESEAEDVLRDSIMRGKYSVLYDAAHGERQTALHLRFKVLELFGAE